MDNFDKSEILNSLKETGHVPNSKNDIDNIDILKWAYINSEFSRRVLVISKEEFRNAPINAFVCDIYIKCMLELIKTNSELDLEKEYDFIISLLEKTPKSYQLWYSLNTIVDSSSMQLLKMSDMRSLLHIDGRNFHLWDFLTMFSKKHDIYNQSIELAQEFIKEDCYNASAISFYINMLNKSSSSINEAYEFMLTFLKEDIYNEAVTTALFYLCKLDSNLIDRLIPVLEEYEKSDSDQLYYIYDLHLLLLRFKGDESKTENFCEKLSALKPEKQSYWEKFKKGVY